MAGARPVTVSLNKHIMRGSPNHEIFHLQIKPFAGSQGLSHREIELYINGRLDENLIDPKFRSEFRIFAYIGHSKGGPASYKALKCFELCYQVQNSNNEADAATIDEIKNICPTSEMEDNFTSQELNNAIETTMTGCRFIIERSNEFARFKEKLQTNL
jgi:hypothetical protein